MVFEIGRVCMKIAGRDANKYCVVIKKIDATYVEIDGQTRRKKVNINHIEPINKILKIKENASSSEVAKALTDAGFSTEEKKKSSKQKTERPKKQKAKKATSEEQVEEKKEEAKPKEVKKVSAKKEAEKATDA